MIKTGIRLPERVEPDAIIEALLEIRFESTTIPEIFMGRIADKPALRGLQQRRLPAYDIPAQMRAVDPSLRYAPLVEFVGADSSWAVRIGSSVLAYHRASPYTGWARFREELRRAVEDTFASAENCRVERLGLRYLNALTAGAHPIRAISDLDLRLAVGGAEVREKVNINMIEAVAADTNCAVRIATKEFMQGAIPADTVVYIDVDVYTPEGYAASDPVVVNEWVSRAHQTEKLAFFSLFHEATLEAWRAKQ